MSEFLFRVPCPAEGCNDREIRTWYHDGCPSSSNYYLTDQGLLRCDHCGKKLNIFDRKWKASSCNHDYGETSLRRIMEILQIASRAESWPGIFLAKTISSLSKQIL